MRIALDAMGGDYAPKEIVDGAVLASSSLEENTQIILVGQEDVIKSHLGDKQNIANITIVHASQIIGMDEHPTKALPQKPDSSIGVGYKLLQKKEADAFCSAGNTGAMHVGAMFSVQPIKGVSRPAIISFVPKVSGKKGIILDVGANTDCKPEHLLQFGELGSIFCEYYFGIKSPKVALLNIGEEAKKGNIISQNTYKLIQEKAKFNFVGNIEGRDLFNDKADVIVCDGFIGNIVIKMAQSYYGILKNKDFTDEFFDNFNYEEIGGSPILGINGNVIIGHGISNALTVKNMLLMAERIVKADIHTKIKEALNAEPV